MLTAAARPYIDASVPVLREHGLAITTRFYQRMFEAHPELSKLFNLGNQASGVQQQSLASAVFAYAANIDNAAALGPVLERIVHKHAAVGIKPSHYPIVGRHLLGAIADVLGDAATPPLLAAWDEAYWLLAGELIAAEARLYQQTGVQAGQMHHLTVVRTESHGEHLRSFYLQTADGRSPGAFLPGQYVSVAIDWPQEDRRQQRQYSLSDAPGQPWWRITVKRETAQPGRPAGEVSNWLHEHVQVGDVLQVSAAFGDFAPKLNETAPIVLISGGVGLTPMVSVLSALAEQASPRRVVFAHATRDAQHHGLREAVVAAASKLPALQSVVFYEHPQSGDQVGRDYDHAGRMKLLPELSTEDIQQAQFYLCGPLPFMRAQWADLLGAGVDAARIQREVFGPDLLDHLL